MTATDRLRDIVQGHVSAEGLHPLATRTGLGIGQIRSICAGRAPLSTSLEQVCAALDLELYVGPPRSVNGQPLSQIHPGEGPPGADIVRVSDPRLAEILSELSRHFDLLNDPGREALLVRLESYFPEIVPHFRRGSRRPASLEQP